MRSELAVAAIVLGTGCTPPPAADAPQAPQAPQALPRFELELTCHRGEHLVGIEGPATPPPSPLRWLGQTDDMRRHACLKRRTVRSCGVGGAAMNRLLAAARRGPLSSRQLFRLAQGRAYVARCLLRVMRFGNPFSQSFDRPFIPPLDGAGRCAKDEALVINLRKSAESLFARAFEARAREPDACTAAPTLGVILHEQAFLAFARGDLRRADSLYARIDPTCQSLGHAPMAALRRADVAYEAALAGERNWRGVDEGYARVVRTCHEVPVTTSNAVPSETVSADKLTYPVPCERILRYVRWKRAFALLSAGRTAEANDRFRALADRGWRRPSWLVVGWWCPRLDDDVLRWGAIEPVSCTTGDTPTFGIVESAPMDPRF